MTPGYLRESIGNALYRQVGRANGQVQSHRSLPVDILESETTYQVVFDAPDAEPTDIEVRYLEGTVKIRIERFRQYRDGYEMRFPGRGMELTGSAELPADAIVEPDAGEATLTETGTLRITIPKGSREEEPTAERSADSSAETDSVSHSSSTDSSTPAGELAVDEQ
ncbi:Hsp20/alpha crystallin family protein [Natronorubrum daqingense]|uniref:Heat-shock protein Hsp20 n=1 Tax=Natronorubrum daqingense TaxID=588898 RepID=A0A1N6YR78_9EURY|nr:Hsp20 family protein [Natronorubrum daqingense]APX95587.1 heat-shock protein Hsp20 [Natronorubrum daqingense]SIR17105.1 Molecular chaperone IbpA, HSP20 family [Natronorubrum daqingense]